MYLGTEQPDFGGWLCNVRPSERYDIYYAVYMVNIDGPALTQVVDGERRWVDTCGWSSKIFIVEYRSDEVPQAICAEPPRPQSPLSDVELEFDAPAGVELLQITEFSRLPCPGLPTYQSWATTHFARLRFAGPTEINLVDVRLEDSEGKQHDPVDMDMSGDLDPDVASWTFDLKDAEPARLIVHYITDDEASTPSPTAGDIEHSETPCVEAQDIDAKGVILTTLYDRDVEVGRIRIVELAVPIHCPWFHRYGLLVEFAQPVAQSTTLEGSVLGQDGRTLPDDGTVRVFFSRDFTNESYRAYHHFFVVPDDVTPAAIELKVGSLRWVFVADPWKVE